eukprot:857892-Rhodomonas_salina.2
MLHRYRACHSWIAPCARSAPGIAWRAAPDASTADSIADSGTDRVGWRKHSEGNHRGERSPGSTIREVSTGIASA